jgi:hypothetical protein
MSIFEDLGGKGASLGEDKLFQDIGEKVFGEFARDFAQQNPGDFLNLINGMKGEDAGASDLLPGLDLFEGGGGAGEISSLVGGLGQGISSLLQVAGQFLPIVLKVLPALIAL